MSPERNLVEACAITSVVALALTIALDTRATLHVLGGCGVAWAAGPRIPCVIRAGEVVDAATVLLGGGDWPAAHGVPLLPRETEQLPTCPACCARVVAWTPIRRAHVTGELASWQGESVGGWAQEHPRARRGVVIVTRGGERTIVDVPGRAALCRALATREAELLFGFPRRAVSPTRLASRPWTLAA